MGGILVVAFVAGLCVQKPEGIKTTPQIQPAEELKLSDFPEKFKEKTVIVLGDDATEIERQAAEGIKNYLIIIGTPKANPFPEEAYAMTNATGVTEGYPSESKGVLEILPGDVDADDEDRLAIIRDAYRETANVGDGAWRYYRWSKSNG